MPTAPRTARALARAELTRAIVDHATAQLAEIGPAALSVRAVARDLGMASSAVYRYFPSRDALLTALIIEAYDDMGSAVEAADAALPRDALRDRLHAIAQALRSWAVAHPHRYALTYGSPVPGYSASAETVGPATRVARALLTLLRDAQEAGRAPAAGPAVSAAERAAVDPIMQMTEPPLSGDFAVRAVAAWATLFGHVSLELFGHMHRGVLDYETHYDHVVEQIAVDLGLAG